MNRVAAFCRSALLLMLAVSCDARGGAVAYDDRALADTLSRLIADAYELSKPGAVERMSALYPDTGVVVSASEGHMTTSPDSLRAGITRFWNNVGRNMRNPRWQWQEVHAERLAPDAAVLTGSWSIPHIAPTNQPHVIRGVWTAVFRRIDGSWRIVHEHLSVPGT